MSSTKDFKITPSGDELETLKRNLTFHPADSAKTKTLSRAEVEGYNASGFIRPVDIYSTDEITAIRKYFDKLLDRTLASGGNSYSISTAHMKYGGVYDILTNKRIVDMVADLLGEDVIAWGSHFFCKMPGGRTRCGMASGCQLLATHAIPCCDRLAGD
jgi:non-heme Fe2+,alpha-ketoglutarate-dependent halogenase